RRAKHTEDLVNPRLFLRNTWYRVAHKPPSVVFDKVLERTGLGRAVLRRMPVGAKRRMYASIFSPDSGAWSVLGGLFRNELVRQYYAMDEAAQRELNRGMLWGGSAGPVWHEAMRKQYADPERFRNEYLPRRAPLVRFLEAAIERYPGQFPTVCEI